MLGSRLMWPIGIYFESDNRKVLVQLKKIIYFFIMIDWLAILMPLYAAQILPLPDQNHAAITIERSLYGAFTGTDFILALLGKSDHFVRMPLKLEESDRDMKFGKMTDHKRIPITDAKYPGDWRAAFLSGERLVLVDAGMLELLVIRSKDFKTVMSTTVPADLLKPAADQGGEPTTFEIQKTRKRFREASRKIFGTRYVGFSEIPDSWEKGATRDFLVASRVPSFPLLMMSCQKKDEVACLISRQCFLEGGPKIDPENIVGLGVLSKSRQIVLGDARRNEIMLYKFNSCFDVSFQRSIALPSRLPKMSNLHVDQGERLWITAALADTFTDSNLFYWDKENWLTPDNSKFPAR
jgi:hypothetical protein